MATKLNYTIGEAARLSGLSDAMVDYLCRSGVLVPSGRPDRGRGRARRYIYGDVVMLRALAHLLKCGVSVARLKTALHSLRDHHHRITQKSLPARFLVAHGDRVYFKHRGQAVEDLTAGGQFAFAFVIELQQISREVGKALQQRRRSTGK